MTFAFFFDFEMLKTIPKNTKACMNTNFLNTCNLLCVCYSLTRGNTRKKHDMVFLGQTHVKSNIAKWNGLLNLLPQPPFPTIGIVREVFQISDEYIKYLKGINFCGN